MNAQPHLAATIKAFRDLPTLTERHRDYRDGIPPQSI